MKINMMSSEKPDSDPNNDDIITVRVEENNSQLIPVKTWWKTNENEVSLCYKAMQT